ncbi:MAG: hypothetical protein R3F56_16875 [Planctomycetota bacterium]
MNRLLAPLIGAVLAIPSLAQQTNSPPTDPAELGIDAKGGPTDPWVAPIERPRAQPESDGDKSGAQAPLAATRDPFVVPNLVFWDTPTAGEIWAAAAPYKVRFASGTATYVPFLGSDAPRSYPLDLRLARVTVGGQPVALAPAPTPERHGQRVVFDHGSVQVWYDVTSEGIEQSFAFHDLPRSGEIVIGIVAATDLEPGPADEHVRFANARGGVTYGKATAVDARGRRLTVERSVHHGQIEIRVPDEFVRTAALPLVVDPFVGTYAVVTGNSRTLREPDIAAGYSGPIIEGALVTCELVFSATDSDVYSYELDENGAVIAGSVATIDITTNSWQAPRVASTLTPDVFATRYLVVAQWSANGASPYSIRGRTRLGGSTTMGNPFVISSPGVPNSGDKIRPDVSGMRVTGPDTLFTVVWERVYTTTDHDVHARQVSADVDPVLRGTGEILVDNAGTYEETPRISRDVGRLEPLARAMVVYRRRTTSGTDIRGRLVRPDGAMEAGFSVATGDALQSHPCVTQQTKPDGFGNILYLVAWRQGYITDGGDTGDIKVALCRHPGATVSPVRLLHQIEGGTHGSWDQGQPCVASDGCRFVVCYTEDFQNTGDLDVRATTLHVFGTAPTAYDFGVTEGRVQVAYRGTAEDQGAVCARSYWLSSPRTENRYCFAWADANGTAANEVRARLYDGFATGGGITHMPTACGDPTYFGVDPYRSTFSIGGTISLTGNGRSVPLIGTPISPPIPICSPSSCRLGVNIVGQLPPPLLVTDVAIPCDPNLIGQSIALQAVLAGGPCFNAISVSDTAVITFR